MLVSVKCEACVVEHHNYYGCSECGMHFSYQRPPKEWKFCPGCGAPFRKPKEKQLVECKHSNLTPTKGGGFRCEDCKKFIPRSTVREIREGGTIETYM